MKSKDLDAMYAEMMADAPPLAPIHDVALHGLTIKQLAEQMGCCAPTAQTTADRMLKDKKWVGTRVRFVRGNGSMGYAMAYRPVKKGGKRE